MKPLTLTLPPWRQNRGKQAAADIDGADYEKLQALMAEQSQLEAQLEAKEERWMYLTDLAERIAKGEYSEI